ncbi:hypothetical protein OH77DRAFT_1420591 [Trametes cingulata]|nr:hypothetical protein OH77DRAFT_1420591 [Trametes cingulata]
MAGQEDVQALVLQGAAPSLSFFPGGVTHGAQVSTLLDLLGRSPRSPEQALPLIPPSTHPSEQEAATLRVSWLRALDARLTLRDAYPCAPHTMGRRSRILLGPMGIQRLSTTAYRTRSTPSTAQSL